MTTPLLSLCNTLEVRLKGGSNDERVDRVANDDENLGSKVVANVFFLNYEVAIV